MYNQIHTIHLKSNNIKKMNNCPLEKLSIQFSRTEVDINVVQQKHSNNKCSRF